MQSASALAGAEQRHHQCSLEGPPARFSPDFTSIGNTLYSLDYFYGGLDVRGVDSFEYRQMWCLQNAGVPRQRLTLVPAISRATCAKWRWSPPDL